LDSQDIRDLKDCKPDHCNLQIPASTIADVHQTIHWSDSNAEQQVNQMAQKKALQHLLDYQQKGNQALGVYNDKHDPTEVPEQFKYMLSYAKVLPKALPDYYNYLLDYPSVKPANVENMFYWENMKFGLKPTLRMVQVVTMKGNNPHEPAYTIAEKQLYSSHYFKTAKDLTYCIRSDDPKQPGFYLIRIMGSEQEGLTGFKGSSALLLSEVLASSGLHPGRCGSRANLGAAADREGGGASLQSGKHRFGSASSPRQPWIPTPA